MHLTINLKYYVSCKIPEYKKKKKKINVNLTVNTQLTKVGCFLIVSIQSSHLCTFLCTPKKNIIKQSSIHDYKDIKIVLKKIVY